jgi:tRNA threonylcarbamoyladenosine biosynthesis protein TsaB
MIALGVDTSTRAGSVALTEQGRVLGELNLDCGGHHQGRLLRSIDFLLEMAGIEISGVGVLAVALGPGTFTGLRVGIATAKGLALAGGIPAVGFSTLWAMAQRYRERGMPIVPLVDAGRGEVYSAVYSLHGDDLRMVVPERSESPHSLMDSLPAEPLLFCGNGLGVCRDLILASRGEKDKLEEGPCFLGTTLARLGTRKMREGGPWSLSSLKPNYIRPPDAEVSGRT